MQARYGGYQHDANEVELTQFRQEAQRSDRGFVQSIRTTIGFKGRKTSTTGSVAELTRQLAALIQAYSVDYQDWILFDNSGAPTVVQLIDGNTIDGVRVTLLPSLGNMQGAEYGGTYVDYECMIQGDVVPPPGMNTGATGTSNILSYQETLTWQGNGGPRIIYIEKPRGEPLAVMASERTLCVAAQSGSMETIVPVSTKDLPDPIWPRALVSDSYAPSISSPVIRGGEKVSYLSQWNYQFVSTTPLVGSPTVKY